ncbi:MAG: hypothetical protein ACOYYF_15390 [Chloroflexota bacterium]|nr:hypothetical protein [Chloroflexota bacterium]MBI5705252.1 hypothetical protein [Chloroflexota bacterium]
MEVRVLPMSGCMMLFLGVFTLGIAPVAMKLKERNWPQRVDEQGLLTRGGKAIAWNEFTGIEKVITRLQGGVTTERYDLHSPKGTVSIVVHRLVDGNKVLQYVWERLPEHVKTAKS